MSKGIGESIGVNKSVGEGVGVTEKKMREGILRSFAGSARSLPRAASTLLVARFARFFLGLGLEEKQGKQGGGKGEGEKGEKRHVKTNEVITESDKHLAKLLN